MQIINAMQSGEPEPKDIPVITFAGGLPGFEDYHQYALVRVDEETPFFYLQSTEEQGLAFIVTSPFLFYPEYEFDLSEKTKGELEISSSDEVGIWCIVTVAEDLARTTINLLAPIVMNMKACIGKQIILHDAGYKTKHPLLQSALEK